MHMSIEIKKSTLQTEGGWRHETGRKAASCLKGIDFFGSLAARLQRVHGFASPSYPEFAIFGKLYVIRIKIFSFVPYIGRQGQ